MASQRTTRYSPISRSRTGRRRLSTTSPIDWPICWRISSMRLGVPPWVVSPVRIAAVRPIGGSARRSVAGAPACLGVRDGRPDRRADRLRRPVRPRRDDARPARCHRRRAARRRRPSDHHGPGRPRAGRTGRATSGRAAAHRRRVRGSRCGSRPGRASEEAEREHGEQAEDDEWMAGLARPQRVEVVAAARADDR